MALSVPQNCPGDQSATNIRTRRSN